MLIDFTKKITNLDGDPIINDKKELTLALVCENALLALTEKNNSLPGAKKVHRAILAQCIHTEGQVDIVAEDVAMIKDVIAESYSPLVIMRAWEILDPKVTDVKKGAINPG
jgi:hypothetical protein